MTDRCDLSHTFIFSHYWRLGVQGQVLAHPGAGDSSPPGLHMAGISPCVHMDFPRCVCICMHVCVCAEKKAWTKGDGGVMKEEKEKAGGKISLPHFLRPPMLWHYDPTFVTLFNIYYFLKLYLRIYSHWRL